MYRNLNCLPSSLPIISLLATESQIIEVKNSSIDFLAAHFESPFRKCINPYVYTTCLHLSVYSIGPVGPTYIL